MHSHKETIKKGPAERQTQKKINEQNAFFMPGEQTLHVWVLKEKKNTVYRINYYNMMKFKRRKDSNICENVETWQEKNRGKRAIFLWQEQECSAQYRS